MDYRRSARHRRDTWYGLKTYVKRFLSLAPVNAALVLAARRFAPASVMARLPVARREVAGVVGGARFVMLDPARCTVAKELFWGGGTRPKPREAFALELFAQLATDADVVLDIGAYTGVFTLVATAVNPQLQAHAFELVPEIHRLLVDNCARNDILSRTTCHNYGLGRPVHSMVIPDRWDGSSLPSSVADGMEFASGVRVPFRALDEVYAALIPPGSRVLAKIDVEGTENDVLRHGQQMLGAYRPDLLCEVLPDAAQPQELEALLAPFGYRFYRVEDAALRPLNGITPHREYWDWLFTTRDAGRLPLTARSG